ncbi:unnamed protein product [Blepharisma stoltei]|uniref:Uncharacterized protein n=1 Tax=Blepharisma stoltei TaxID=1481888 RepID=A0AAU9KHP2_9CILI|nr:unnamed protein product [Blepharisma stoltei]
MIQSIPLYLRIRAIYTLLWRFLEFSHYSNLNYIIKPATYFPLYFLKSILKGNSVFINLKKLKNLVIINLK